MSKILFSDFAELIASVFNIDSVKINRETASYDVDGWDSVTHAHLLFEIEDRYRVELQADRVFECANVGELFDVLRDSLPEEEPATPVTKQKTIIIYGNCQAEHLAGHLNYMMSLHSDVRFHFILNFFHPISGWSALSEDVLANADYLWEQYDENYRFPYADQLPQTCRTIRFPPLDFNLLWPFAAKDPRNKPEPPDFPYGRLTYGDSVAVNVVQKGLRGEEAYSVYVTAASERIARTNFKRLEQFERVRLTRREEHCDVKIADFIFENYKKFELFCTWNHPTGRSLMAVARGLLHESGLLTSAATPKLLGDIAYAEAHWNPLGQFELPVHHAVAEALGLKWFDPARLYNISGTPKNYHNYIVDYING